MPSIRGQKINDVDGIEIIRMDGSTWSLTPAEVIADFQARSGSVATRRQETFDWAKAQIAANVPELADEVVDLDFSWTGASTANRLVFGMLEI